MDPIGRIQVVDQSSDSHDFEHSFEVFVVVFAALKLCWKRKLRRPVHDATFGLLTHPYFIMMEGSVQDLT